MFQPDVPSVHVVRVVATDSNGVVRCRAGWCEDVRPIPALPLAQVHLLNTVALDNDVGHPDRSRIHLGARGYLNAESVNHRNNLPNTFVWRLEQRPPGSNAVLDAPALVDGKGAVFVADRLGRYVVSLRLINSSVATCAEVHVFDAVDR